MWKPFVEGNTLFLLHFEKDGENLSFLVTNLDGFWECSLTTEDLVSNFKDSNPLIDATPDQIVSNFLEILNSNFQNVSIGTEEHDYDLEITFEKECNENGDSKQTLIYDLSLNGIANKYHNDDTLKTELMTSSLQTVYFLEKQKQMLLKVIEKKDRELEEYRMEKGEISRSDLKTDKFDPNSLQVTSDNLLLNIFSHENNGEFWKVLKENNGDVETEHLHVELEPWNAKPKKRVIHSGKEVVKKGSGVVFKKAKTN